MSALPAQAGRGLGLCALVFDQRAAGALRHRGVRRLCLRPTRPKGIDGVPWEQK